MAKNSDKILAIGVGLNLDPLNKDINDASKAAKDGMAKVGDSIKGAGDKADQPLKQTKDKIISLSSQMRQARLDAQQLAMGGKEMSDAFSASIAKAASLKDQIQAVDSAIIASSTNLNNLQTPALTQARSSYNGMAMSINQLTREMPAFTYSMQTGFMAISNNIPMFVDQINAAKNANLQLAQSGQPVTSVFKQVASSLFSFQTLMGVGITILTVYGEKIYDYITSSKNATKSIKEQEDALKKLNEERAKEFDKIWKPQQERKKIAESELRVMKDGLKKQLAASTMARTSELDDNFKAFKTGERSAFDYEKVKNRIKEFYILEEERIRKQKNEKELKETKEQQQKVFGLYAETAQIKAQFAGGGQMELPSIVGPAKPTKQGLDEKETLAFKIRQEADNARNEMLKAKVILMEAQEKMFNSIAEQKEALINSVFNGIGRSIGNSIAQSLSGENSDPFADIGVVLIKSLGEMASMLGAQLIAIGSGMLIAGIPNGFQYIAGGTALVIAGAAASGLAGRKSPSTGAGSSSNLTPSSNFNSGSASNYIGSNNSGNIVINGMIKGNDIQLVNGRNDRKFNRSLRFG